MYVKLVDGEVDTYPYGIRMLRQDNPNTSFPKALSDETLSEFGMKPVVIEEFPTYDSRAEKVSQSESPESVDGVWTIKFTVADRTTEEIAEYDEAMAKGNRATRNAILRDSDWTQVADSALTTTEKSSWVTYRGNLRDLPSHTNWPNLSAEDWPTAP